MSTEQEATPPARIWIEQDVPGGYCHTFWRDCPTTPHALEEHKLNGYEIRNVEYIRADSFDTMRDALREIVNEADNSPAAWRIDGNHAATCFLCSGCY